MIPERARFVWLCLSAIGLAFIATAVARALTVLIQLITNLSFHGRFSIGPASPAEHALGGWVILLPVAGALLIGLMARFGSAAIRGHGIPEAMEQVLFNESRIPPRVTWLKPLSAAISIGTGGPFGAEGPIIATGGALGSLLGQLQATSADERKTLLAAGAAAGMTATFGTPVSAVLLAIELLLFEYRPRSLIPVALATATAAGARIALLGDVPMFVINGLTEPGSLALIGYVVLGGLVGAGSVLVTRAVYAVEDSFERLPIHWMWWPAIGALAVGLLGWLEPKTMGVGYDNIGELLEGRLVGQAVLWLCGLKLLSWTIALGSGTSGGTLAPLLTVGGGIGSLLAGLGAAALPTLGLDLRMGALVGMAAMFAGASRALLASAVFAFELTRQPIGLLPLLGGCTAAFLVASLLMRHSIMTEKIARRGSRVPTDYAADLFDQLRVGEVALRPVVCLSVEQSLDEVRAWLGAGGPGRGHQGFPVLDTKARVLGVLTRRDLLGAAQRSGWTPIGQLLTRAPVVVHPDSTLTEAADRMVAEEIGRLPVLERAAPHRLVGIVTRSDLLAAHRRRIAHRDRQPARLGPWAAR